MPDLCELIRRSPQFGVPKLNLFLANRVSGPSQVNLNLGDPNAGRTRIESANRSFQANRRKTLNFFFFWVLICANRFAPITHIRRRPDYSSNLCPPKTFAIWLFYGGGGVGPSSCCFIAFFLLFYIIAPKHPPKSHMANAFGRHWLPLHQKNLHAPFLLFELISPRLTLTLFNCVRINSSLV